MSELFLAIFNTAITAAWLVLAVLAARLLLKMLPPGQNAPFGRCWPFELESILSPVPSTQTLPPTALYDPVPQIHTGFAALNSTINPVFTQTFQPEPVAAVNPLRVAVTVASGL